MFKSSLHQDDLDDDDGEPKLMNLKDLWSWKNRKLPCKIRTETGNPALDDIRDRFQALGKDLGVDLREILSEMKHGKKKMEQTGKLVPNHDDEKMYKEILTRSHVMGATEQTLSRLRDYGALDPKLKSQKNFNKQFVVHPISPPKRVLNELQREQSKPLRLPDQEDHKLATAKLDRKLAKQRAARLAAIDRSTKGDDLSNKNGESLKKFDTTSILEVFPKYQGDMFGSRGPYLESMLYQSRMADVMSKTHRYTLPDTPNESESSKASQSANLLDPTRSKSEEDSLKSDKDESAGSNVQSGVPDLKAKLTCAAALCNWSRNSLNAKRLASEGAVRAIRELCLEPHPRILTFATAAFRFMSDHSPLALAMIDESAINTMSDVIANTPNEFICGNIAIALVNLTRINGKEAAVVDASIVLALMNLITIRPELSGTCARGLYNLTCVDSQYQQMERVIRALITLSVQSTSANVKHICAAALCNLADLKTVRSRLVEEGIVNVVGVLSRGAEMRTRRVCAVILQNLSATKLCRVEMTSRNSVTVAHSLSTDQDPIILRCIGLALSRLAMEPVNCSRIIYESGIAALCTIGVKYPTIPGISQTVAFAFQLLSSRSAARISVVREGSITAIASLLRMSTDLLTLQHSLLAVCNLLTESESHLPIVQQGLIITLVKLSTNDNELIKEFCALAFKNLSVSLDSRKHIVNSGAISSIISLTKHRDMITKRRCATTIYNVSSYEPGVARMIEDDVIPCLVDLVLSSDVDTVHFSCSALCKLCSSKEYAEKILQSGAIKNLVKGVIEGQVVTKEYCGAVLSSLSSYDVCVVPLCEFGVIQALETLSTLSDEVTRQRCLVAYANLSCETSVQSQMIESGVVKLIAGLADSYQEINFMCCARAMCNLACNPETKLRVAMEGAVNALLMISMVRSVDTQTKVLCVIAFMNLLDDTTVNYMLAEGIVGAIANLSKVPDPRMTFLCAKYFNFLSSYPSARVKLVERPSILSSIFFLYNAKENLNREKEKEKLALESNSKNNNNNSLSSTMKGTLKSSLLSSSGSPKQQTINHNIINNNNNKNLYSNNLSSSSSSTLELIDSTGNNNNNNNNNYDDNDWNMELINIIIARTVSNLLLDPSSRDKIIIGGGLRVLEKGLLLEQEDASLGCIKALFSSVNESSHLLAMSKTLIPLTLSKLLVKSRGERYLFATKTLAMLAWDSNSRTRLQTIEFLSNLLRTILCKLEPSSAKYLCSILRNTLDGFPLSLLEEFVTSGGNRIVLTMRRLEQALSTSEINQNLDAKIEGYENLVLTYHLLSQYPHICMESIATSHTVRFLFKAVQSIPKNSMVAYSSAVLMYRFAFYSHETRLRTITQETIQLFKLLSTNVECTDVILPSIHRYLTDSKCKSLLCTEEVSQFLSKMTSMNLLEESLINLVTIFFILSKMPRCRVFLLRSPIQLDILMQSLIAKKDNQRLKINCGRVIKNLTLDPNDAIEEGAVAELISISLEGKENPKPENELILPEIRPFSTQPSNPPSCRRETVVGAEWFEAKSLTSGGLVGKGPDAPNPEAFTEEGSPQYPQMAEEIDASEGEIAKTKMAFAKMQIPNELKNNFLLNDNDFEIKPEDLLMNSITSSIGSDSLSSNDINNKNGLEGLKTGSELEFDKETDRAPSPLPNQSNGPQGRTNGTQRFSRTGLSTPLTRTRSPSVASGSAPSPNATSNFSPTSPTRKTIVSQHNNNNTLAGGNGGGGAGGSRRSMSSSGNSLSISEQAAQLGLYK